jgi:hypothetical protein
VLGDAAAAAAGQLKMIPRLVLLLPAAAVQQHLR